MPSCRYARRHSALVHLSCVFSALLLPAVFSIFSVEFVFILCLLASAANPASPHLSHESLIRSEENETLKRRHTQTDFFFPPPACKSSFMCDWLQFNTGSMITGCTCTQACVCVCVCVCVSCSCTLVALAARQLCSVNLRWNHRRLLL